MVRRTVQDLITRTARASLIGSLRIANKIDNWAQLQEGCFWVVFCVNKAVIGISVDTVRDLRNNRAWKDSKQLIYQ